MTRAYEIAAALREFSCWAEYGEDADEQAKMTEELCAAADLIENQQQEIEALKSALHEMAVDFVAMGRIDYWFCDDVPTELHMKHQPKNDGNYENEPCTECVKEYYLQKASGEIDARSRADEGGEQWND